MSFVSISKGVFVQDNGLQQALKQPKNGALSLTSTKCDEPFTHHMWHRRFKALWTQIETKIQHLTNEMFCTIQSSLIEFIRISCKHEWISEIPTACLLTGINMPDHHAQFGALCAQIRREVSPHVAHVKAEDAQSLKYLVESVCQQLMSGEESAHPRNFYSFPRLVQWYRRLYKTRQNICLQSPSKRRKRQQDEATAIQFHPIVIVMPDFETFPEKIVRDFLLLAHSYLHQLPIAVVVGLATSVATLHRMLPYNVTSKILVRLFNCPPSSTYLNNVIERILISDDCPFHLGGKLFQLLTDVFLFYDLSVSSFISNFKFAMMEHFSYGNAMALCCNNRRAIRDMLIIFQHDDLENCRRLLSFRRMVEAESPTNRIRLIEDDDFFRQILHIELDVMYSFIKNFHLFVKILHLLVADLPNAPLGKQLRNVYSIAVSERIVRSDAYKQCMRLLHMQSKAELCAKVVLVRELLASRSLGVRGATEQNIVSFTKALTEHYNSLQAASVTHMEDISDSANSSMDAYTNSSMESSMVEELSDSKHDKSCTALQMSGAGRRQFALQLKAQAERRRTQYERARDRLLAFLDRVLNQYLDQTPSDLNFHEIFFFDDEQAVRNHIIGAQRAAVHVALNDPHAYLRCECCKPRNATENGTCCIRATMPDICIAYKLHLECGKFINLFDWLQAFLTIVDQDGVEISEDEDDDEDGGKQKKKLIVKPELQARFTQAVAELEYLGFIKSTKRKVDHVTRLTWGASS